jgi:hypothetical protein
LPLPGSRLDPAEVPSRTLLKVTGNVWADLLFRRNPSAPPQPGRAVDAADPPAGLGSCYSTATLACRGALQDACRWHGDLATAARTVNGSCLRRAACVPGRPLRYGRRVPRRRRRSGPGVLLLTARPEPGGRTSGCPAARPGLGLAGPDPVPAALIVGFARSDREPSGR